MMSLQTIISLEQEQARKAKRHGLQPMVVAKDTNVQTWTRFPFPNLGSYVPKGWEVVETVTVDKTGEGAPYLGIHSIDSFKRWLAGKVDGENAFALVSEAQFTVDVGVFRKVQ